MSTNFTAALRAHLQNNSSSIYKINSNALHITSTCCTSTLLLPIVPYGTLFFDIHATLRVHSKAPKK
jgi:hypothetical protein